MNKSPVKLAVLLVLGCAVTGCGLDQWRKDGFKVGPNYEVPTAPLATEWIDYRSPDTQPAAATQTHTPDLAQWWSVFHDPVLDSLMHDAYGQNLNLKQAGERIIEARAGRDIAFGNLFPQFQNVAGSWTANKLSTHEANPLPNEWFHNVNAGFNLAWEMDFWGRFRRAVEAADATLEASVADYDNVMVLLLSDVGRNYIQYRTFQERLFLARQNAEIQRQAYELAQHNFQAGATTERDMQQAKQVYEQTLSLVPQFEQGVRIANNSLCVLLGIAVQDLSPRLGETGVIPQAPASVAIGIPAELLRRRPDVRRAERQAAAQSAQIGVAKSELYPHFFLNGSIGVSAQYFGGLFYSPDSLIGSIGPSFQWNILNYGRIENAVKGQEALFREFMALYQETVLQANGDAENAIITFAKSKEQTVYLAESVAAASRTVQISYDQYKAGTIDFTPVFLFEQTLTSQQDALAQSQGNIALSLVDLYRALGGGWEARLNPEGIVGPQAPAPTTQRAPLRPNVLTPPAPPPAPKP